MTPAPPHTAYSMEEFCNQLRRHKLKATRQRLAVHEVMLELGHASAEDVCARLQERGAAITTASVYNILTQLADVRIYGRCLSSTNKMFFDVDTAHHIHLYDRENHSFRELDDEQLTQMVKEHFKRRRFKGYSIEEIDIQLIARPTRKSKKS